MNLFKYIKRHLSKNLDEYDVLTSLSFRDWLYQYKNEAHIVRRNSMIGVLLGNSLDIINKKDPNSEYLTLPELLDKKKFTPQIFFENSCLPLLYGHIYDNKLDFDTNRYGYDKLMGLSADVALTRIIELLYKSKLSVIFL